MCKGGEVFDWEKRQTGRVRSNIDSWGRSRSLVPRPARHGMIAWSSRHDHQQSEECVLTEERGLKERVWVEAKVGVRVTIQAGQGRGPKGRSNHLSAGNAGMSDSNAARDVSDQSAAGPGLNCEKMEFCGRKEGRACRPEWKR